jgi:excinuclease ABC subunit B
MKNAIEETDRRRIIQQEYNIKNNINPQSTTRNIDKSIVSKKIIKQAIVNYSEYENLSEIEIKKEIKKLEKKMLELIEENNLALAKELKKRWDQLKIILKIKYN